MGVGQSRNAILDDSPSSFELYSYAERDLGRLAVLLRVVFVPVGVAARHRVPGLHLLRHERASVERREGIALRLQQTAEVGGEAHGADGHAAVRLRGEDLAVDLVRVGRGVARGMLHHVLAGLHHVRVDVVDGMAPAERANAQLPVRAHRDVGTAVVGVDDLDHADRRRAARGSDGTEDFALARVGERMERGERANVVEVRVHVGVEDDLLRRAKRNPGGACGRHNYEVSSFHAASIPHFHLIWRPLSIFRPQGNRMESRYLGGAARGGYGLLSVVPMVTRKGSRG